MEEAKKKIVLVDDSVTNLAVGKNVLSDLYEVYTVPSGKDFFRLLEHVKPDLVLLDVEMPEMDGYEVIRQLKAEKHTTGIPVIFLTAKGAVANELEGLSLGAVDYISKPFSPPLLRKRIEGHLLTESQRRQLADYSLNLEAMVEKKTRTILEMQGTIVDVLSVVVEYRDDETGGHINRTRKYIRILLDEMMRLGIYADEITKWDRRLVVFSSALHDVGKVAVPDRILLKPGKLDPEELEIMKKHVVYGSEILEKIERDTQDHSFIEHAKLMASGHHEKWDGSGYPAGLSGTDISLQGRIMAFADVYDALISKRPYKAPMSHETAVDIIRNGNGTHFDPLLGEVFLGVADRLREASEYIWTPSKQ